MAAAGRRMRSTKQVGPATCLAPGPRGTERDPRRAEHPIDRDSGAPLARSLSRSLQPQEDTMSASKQDKGCEACGKGGPPNDEGYCLACEWTSVQCDGYAQEVLDRK